MISNNLTENSFPLLWVNDQEGSLGSFRNHNELSLCTRSVAKKKSFYSDSTLVSNDGNTYRVVDVDILNTVEQNSVKRAIFRIFDADTVRVKLHLENEGKIPLEDLKQRVYIRLNADNELWDSDGNLEKLIDIIRDARSVRKVVRILTKRYYNELTFSPDESM